jgi:RND superfamily putative drug exporter
MRAAMVRLSGLLGRRRWLVIGVWLALVAAALPFFSRQTEDLTGGGFDVPGSASEQVQDAVTADYPSEQEGSVVVVLRAEPGATPAQLDSAVARVADAVAGVEDFRLVDGALAPAERRLASEGVGVIPVVSDLPPSRQIDGSSDLREELSPGEAVDGVTPYLAGQPAAWAGLQELSQEDLEKAETVGFPIVALILITVFGSLAAASLPLALGFVSVAVTGAVIYLLSQQMEMSVFVINMASMIGIGVAVDYSLFILARFREEVRAGRSADQARGAALATSGLAVTFSGLAVVISVAGLWMIDNQTLRSMALGAMIVVAVAILTAVVLLPALIRVLGHRVEAGGPIWSLFLFTRRLTLGRRRRRGSTTPGGAGFWDRWTERVMRRPVLSVLATSAVLLTLAIPVLSLETGTGALDQFPEGHDVREGAALASTASGGATNPVQVLAEFERGDLSEPRNRADTAALARAIAADPAAAGVAEPVSGDGEALIMATTDAASDSDAAYAFVDRLRDEIVPASALAERADVLVGGETARIVDVQNQIDGSMWKIIAFVLGFSFVVLMVMLRSLILPLKAIVMNLLSIGAAYGVLVVVFQWGWIDGFLGFESSGAIDVLTPPLILAVVFGLSMDYEVFLLSRIRERYEAHGDNRRAVAEGLASSARTISSAALIMTSVFAVFVLTGVPSIKELGLGNAVAIALDATLVRLILVPAAMQLMGRWNWWLPGWLDRILPRLSFEGGAPAEPGTEPVPSRASV